jgi:hypothetical protein
VVANADDASVTAENIEAALGYIPVTPDELEETNEKATAAQAAAEGGTAAQWWLRSPRTGTSQYVWIIGITGGMTYNSQTVTIGYRPAFILPSDFDVTNYLA